MMDCLDICTVAGGFAKKKKVLPPCHCMNPTSLGTACGDQAQEIIFTESDNTSKDDLHVEWISLQVPFG